MKIVFATTLLAAAFPASWGFINKIDQTKVLKNVGHKTRKLADQQAEVDEYEFLQNYEQVYMTCNPNMEMTNENGEVEYGAVVYRLCPTGATCNKDGQLTCKKGYGDYVVSLQTYMYSFLEQFQQAQQNNGGNNGNNQGFNIGQLGQCRQYRVENKNDQADDQGEEAAYFIGPLCTTGGDIRIAFFKGDANGEVEEQCTPSNESNDFYTLTGFTLPWSSSILEDDKCKPYYCSAVDENGEVEYNKFCINLMQESTQKCEEQMEFYSPYGKDTSGCQDIKTMMAATSSGSSAGGWVVFGILVAIFGAVGVFYFLNQKKKKGALSSQEGLMM